MTPIAKATLANVRITMCVHNEAVSSVANGLSGSNGAFVVTIQGTGRNSVRTRALVLTVPGALLAVRRGVIGIFASGRVAGSGTRRCSIREGLSDDVRSAFRQLSIR
jgi:hypothetical protein